MTLFSIPSLLLIGIIGYTLAGPVDNNNSRDSVDSTNACVDYYDHVCKNATIFKGFSRKRYENNIHDNYKRFKQGLIDALASKENGMDLSRYDSPAMKLEQQLYQSCMRLGGETQEYKDDKPYDLNSLEHVFIPILKKFGGEIDENGNWQDLIEELSKVGLGTVFFDISVTKDPQNLNKSIILVQPPSLKKWDSIKIVDTIGDMYSYFQKKTYNYCKNTGQIKSNVKNSLNELRFNDESAFLESTEFTNNHSTEESIEVEPICKNLETVSEDKPADFSSDIPIQLINRLIKLIMLGMPNSQNQTMKIEHDKFTIKTWNETYNKFKESNSSKINWVRLIQTEFKKVGITVNDSDEVLVRNLQYFEKLAKISGSPNINSSDIVKVVQNIIVAENIRYYDWEYVLKLQSYDKSSFCYEQTKLYGLSEVVLKTLVKKELDLVITVSQEIIDGIVQVFDEQISKARGLTEADKASLKANLKTITYNALDNHDIDIHFEYDDIELTGDFSVDIYRYRNMMRNRALSSLKKNLSLSHAEPFSFNEFGNNRNRFIIYSMFEAGNQDILYVHPYIGKEAYYATFGVNIARFLHTLLIEKEGENDFYRRDIEWLTPRNTYPHSVVKCFVPKNIAGYGYQLGYSTIAEIFSMRIAAEALKKNDEDLSIKLFYKAYLITQCDAESKMVKKVLSNLDELPEALHCSAAKMAFPKCEMNLFEK